MHNAQQSLVPIAPCWTWRDLHWSAHPSFLAPRLGSPISWEVLSSQNNRNKQQEPPDMKNSSEGVRELPITPEAKWSDVWLAVCRDWSCLMGMGKDRTGVCQSTD